MNHSRAFALRAIGAGVFAVGITLPTMAIAEPATTTTTTLKATERRRVLQAAPAAARPTWGDLYKLEKKSGSKPKGDTTGSNETEHPGTGGGTPGAHE
jgi:hypothetical protein